MTTHTPGPWLAKQKQDGDWVVLSEDRSKAGLRTRRVDDYHGAFSGPNARLIAAAPELLQSCEQAEYWLNEQMETGELVQPDEMLRVLRSAIAKAKGA